jgi:hypothetical protein
MQFLELMKNGKMIKRVNKHLRYHIKNIMPKVVRHILQPRKIQAFCVGAAKTGTTSIAEMFKQHYRAGHEPEYSLMVAMINQHFHHRLTDDEFCQSLKKHEKRVWLDVNSSCFLGYRSDLLYRTFPNAKYILTVREPKSWLKSIFTSNIKYSASIPLQARWHEVFFQPHKFSYTRYDAILRKYNLYPLDSFLNYWVFTNCSVMQAIPDNQLLILDTRQLSHSDQLLSDFLKIAPGSINAKTTHKNKTKEKYDIISLIDANYLQDRIDTHCAEWIPKLFN